MNYLIQEVARSGLSQSVYSAICTAGAFISFLYSVWHGRRFRVAVWKVLIILVATYLYMSVLQSAILQVLQYIKNINFLGIETSVNSIVRVFVFIPLAAFIISRIMKLKWSLVCDLIALFPLLMSGINQLACLFTGCCNGYVCSWGLYSVRTGEIHFPVPVLETILTLLIFFCLVYRTRRRGYVSDGTLFPLMLVCYGIMRFVCEMLRDNEKIFLGCSAMAIHAIFMGIVGSIWLLRARKKLTIK